MLLSVARGDTAKRALRGAALAREMLRPGSRRFGISVIPG
jgi:hypothetical protein